MSTVFDSLFASAQDVLLTVHGEAATYYADSSDTGTSCTVLLERRGSEDMGYGTQQVVVVVVSRDIAGDDPAPGYASFSIGGVTWTVDLLLGEDEGTNATDLALLCSGGRRYGGLDT